MVNYIADPTQGQIFKGNKAWGSGEDTGQANQVQQALDLFRTQFRNLLGREPDQNEISNFAQNSLYGAWNQPGDLTYGDMSGLANAYISNSFGPQMNQFAEQQQTDALGRTQDRVGSLVKDLNQKTSDYLTGQPAQDQIRGNLNNNGMLNSGAYSQTMAGLLAQGALQNEASALGGVSIPALQNIQGLSAVPYQNAMQGGQGALSHLNNIQDFDMQSQLGKAIAEMMQPSGFGKNLGYASSSAQAAGNLMQGGAGAAKATPSYVCREMVKRGLLCDADLEDFYMHLFPAVPVKARAFWHYAQFGQELVNRANKYMPNWPVKMKPLVFDRVMAEKDPVKAVDLYGQALKELCYFVGPHLWDERVMRSGLFDSLPFIPLLFLCKPYRKNFWRCLGAKFALFYDRPRCGVHYAR